MNLHNKKKGGGGGGGGTVSGVSHSLADGIQCIGMNGVLFQGDQVVKSCYQDGCVTYM